MYAHGEALVREISKLALRFRIDVLDMVRVNMSGHIGGSFSIAEIVTSLYFHHLRIDPENPAWPERDRFVLSKGHACPMLYAALAHRGFFDPKELSTFRSYNSRLQGAPDPNKTPGVEVAAGPLGHGIAIGAGMALALRQRSTKPSSQSAPSSRASTACVYVLLGDGELGAGVIWEGALTAAKYRLGNLTAILDYNGVQQTGATTDVLPLEPIAEKWRAFGWHVVEIHGHNVTDILNALDLCDEVHAQPSIIIARTVKGKGVSFMEYDHRWHGKAPSNEEYRLAVEELQKEIQTWEK